MAEPSISAATAVLMDGEGKILYQKAGDRKSLIASTTKLMTAIVVLENAGLDEKVYIRPEYCDIEGSSMYLRAGSTYTVRELLLGLLLVSGNDAAQALACYTAENEHEFVKLMNRKAAELGMEDSSFANPHGLDSPEHFSTAIDMGRLMVYCMKNRVFRELCGTKSCQIKGLTLVNHNRLLLSCEGCRAGKTGYTMAAGRCLVSCCERNGKRLICVTLSAPGDWEDHKKLYDWGYASGKSKK